MRDIKKIVIYSVGLLGGSFGAAVKQAGFTGEVVGVSSPRGIEGALSVGAIDSGVGYDDAPLVLADADMIILASPINAITAAMEKIGECDLQEGVLISDVGSTMATINSVAEQVLPSHVSFIGGHPMAGSEKSGPTASDPFLFQNAVYVLSQSQLTKGSDLVEFEQFLTDMLRCRVINIDPDTHDTIAATVSHVPHIVAVAMVNSAASVNAEVPGTLDLAAGGFKSLTRIASSPYGMWNDIFETNRDAVASVLKRTIDELSDMHELLLGDGLEVKFNNAAETRKELTVNKKGFLGPLHEIVVTAEDRPGFLSKMTSLMSDNDINIRDIELLKVREGEAGTFMLAFSSENEAEKAIAILEQNQFTARSR